MMPLRCGLSFFIHQEDITLLRSEENTFYRKRTHSIGRGRVMSSWWCLLDAAFRICLVFFFVFVLFFFHFILFLFLYIGIFHFIVFLVNLRVIIFFFSFLACHWTHGAIFCAALTFLRFFWMLMLPFTFVGLFFISIWQCCPGRWRAWMLPFMATARHLIFFFWQCCPGR